MGGAIRYVAHLRCGCGECAAVELQRDHFGLDWVQRKGWLRLVTADFKEEPLCPSCAKAHVENLLLELDGRTSPELQSITDAHGGADAVNAALDDW